MNTATLTATLPAILKAGLRPLIVGAPGVGKTDIVREAAASIGMDVVLMHPAISDPTDYKGLPFAAPGATAAQFLPYGDLAALTTATKPTLAFLDDLGQAPGAVQAALMQLILGRQVGQHRVPDCVTFAAATNRRQDRAGVGQLLEPVKSRFDTILHVEADVEAWAAWALTAGVRPELIAFLRWRSELLSKFEPSAEITNSPSPRGWSSVSRLLAAGLDTVELVQGAVGQGAAVELVSFLRTWQSLPNIAELLRDPASAMLPPSHRPDVAYAIAAKLASIADASNFASIVTYCDRLTADSQAEVSVLIVRDCVKKNPKIATSQAFARIAASLGNLYT